MLGLDMASNSETTVELQWSLQIALQLLNSSDHAQERLNWLQRPQLASGTTHRIGGWAPWASSASDYCVRLSRSHAISCFSSIEKAKTDNDPKINRSYWACN